MLHVHITFSTWLSQLNVPIITYLFLTVTRICRFSLECFPNITSLWFSWTSSKLLNTGEVFGEQTMHCMDAFFPVQRFPRDLEIFLNLAFQHLCEANTIQMLWPCSCRQESWESREAFGRWETRSQTSHYKVGALIKEGESVFNYPLVGELPSWSCNKFWHFTDGLIVTNSFVVSYAWWKFILFKNTMYS